MAPILCIMADELDKITLLSNMSLAVVALAEETIWQVEITPREREGTPQRPKCLSNDFMRAVIKKSFKNFRARIHKKEKQKISEK